MLKKIELTESVYCMKTIKNSNLLEYILVGERSKDLYLKLADNILVKRKFFSGDKLILCTDFADIIIQNKNGFENKKIFIAK